MLGDKTTQQKYSGFNLNFIIFYKGCYLEPQLLEKPLVLARLVPENNIPFSTKKYMAKLRHKKNISGNLHTPTTEGFFFFSLIPPILQEIPI